MKTSRGERVVALYESLAPRGTIYLKSIGKPYPVAIVFSGRRHDTVRFGQWGDPVSLTPPEGALDLSKLRGATVTKA